MINTIQEVLQTHIALVAANYGEHYKFVLFMELGILLNVLSIGFYVNRQMVKEMQQKWEERKEDMLDYIEDFKGSFEELKEDIQARLQKR